jgi:hypothetical protein
MEGYLVHGGIALTRGGSVRIEDGAGMVVHVEQGELWITQDGEARDHIVGAGAGRWFRLERDGATWLEATQDARISLSAPMPSNYARRIMLTPARAAAPRLLYDAAVRGDWLTSLRYRFRFLEKKRPSAFSKALS